jgi:hypothetical protein
MWQPNEQEDAEIVREYTRIGIAAGARLPLPQGIGSAADYLSFLRQVPDGSGVAGFTATMAHRGTKR